MDPDTARDVLAQIERLASNEFAASFADGDRHPPVFDPRDVVVSLCRRRSRRASRRFATLSGGGWRCPRNSVARLPRPRCGGRSAELILGSNPGVWFYSSGPDFAHTIWRLGTEEQRKVARCMADGPLGIEHGAHRARRRV